VFNVSLIKIALSNLKNVLIMFAFNAGNIHIVKGKVTTAKMVNVNVE